MKITLDTCKCFRSEARRVKAELVTMGFEVLLTHHWSVRRNFTVQVDDQGVSKRKHFGSHVPSAADIVRYVQGG